MKNSQKGFIVPLLLVLVAVLLIGGLAYFFLGDRGVDSSGYQSKDILPSNTNPMYGFSSYDDYRIHRNETQATIDDAFVADVLNRNPNTLESSNYLIKDGYEYLQKKDFETAIKRFNQAWLVDHNNYYVYWGFANGIALKDRNEPALKYFDMALEKFDLKYANGITSTAKLISKDGLICEIAMRYALAYADGNNINGSYLEKAKELISSINTENAAPQCVSLANDLKVKGQ